MQIYIQHNLLFTAVQIKELNSNPIIYLFLNIDSICIHNIHFMLNLLPIGDWTIV